MLNFLDLLVIVFLAVAAFSLLSVVLMFVVKNPLVQKISLGLTVLVSLGLGVSYLPSFLNFGFDGQFAAGILFILMGIGGGVLALAAKDDPKKFLAARILAAAGLVLGIANAFLI
ncbi:MAG: hypothetical protein IKU11_03770 [Clostridia bacterium]|nr:hypothetical protein [Clostridia bacterium]